MRNEWLRILPRSATAGCATLFREVVPSQIEKDILIEAPIEDVWRVLTEPEHIKQWFAKECELDGNAGRLSFESGQTYYLHVEAFEPPHRFAYRWLHEQGTTARPDNSMLVEFTLQAENGHTRLHLVESGFDQVDWSDERKARYAEDHSNGWERFTGLLREYAPKVAR
jgi:uncharacterized protein YndB with AHSA1/START domain